MLVLFSVASVTAQENESNETIYNESIIYENDNSFSVNFNDTFTIILLSIFLTAGLLLTYFVNVYVGSLILTFLGFILLFNNFNPIISGVIILFSFVNVITNNE